MASINTKITSISMFGIETATKIVGDTGREAVLKIRSGGGRTTWTYTYTDFDGDRYVLRTDDFLHVTLDHMYSHEEFDPDCISHIAFITGKVKQTGKRFPSPIAA